MARNQSKRIDAACAPENSSPMKRVLVLTALALAACTSVPASLAEVPATDEAAPAWRAASAV